MAITFLKGGAFGNRLGQQEKVVSGLYPQGKKSHVSRKWIRNSGRELLCSSGTSAQCSVMTSKGRMGSGEREGGPRGSGYVYTYS